MRGCLILIVGFLVGLAVSLFFVARPPAGTVAPSASDVRITISDGYLARRIGRKVRSLGMTQVSGVQVASAPPSQLIARGQLAVAGTTTPAALTLEPMATDGTVRVRIVSSQVDGIPIPSIFTTLVEGVVNRAVKRSIGSGVRIVGTRVTAQGLVIWADYPQG